jgi:hypothetical protein
VTRMAKSLACTVEIAESDDENFVLHVKKG